MQLHLEVAVEAQIAQCVPVFYGSEIYERYFKEEGRMERVLRAGAERRDLYLAVTDGGEIAGAMRIDPRGFCGLYAYLSLIGVRDAFRGRRVGAFLMDQFEARARQAGGARAALMVSDFNTGAQAFYRARGYWLLGTLPQAARPDIDELVMLKDL